MARQNVLSVCDGISCGQIALNKAGIKYDKYFASEIDKHVISVTQKNFPKTIQVGNISNLQSKDFHNIFLLMSGSPCQGFSRSGKQLNFEDPRSKLFFEYVRLLREIKPKYFFFENVSMKKEWRDIISKELGVEGILMNSNLVSAQNRPRIYWTNIPNITQPEEQNIHISNVLQKQEDIHNYESYIVDVPYKKQEHVVFDGIYCLTERRTEEAKKIRKEHMKKFGKDFTPFRSKELVARMDGKANCLTATVGKEHYVFDGHSVRYMTPIEWERLQCLPDEYTSTLSNAQRYKAIGNGWNVDTIVHILKNIKQI